MTEIPEIKGGDAEIMSTVGRAKRSAMHIYMPPEQSRNPGMRPMEEIRAEIIKEQRAALNEAREIVDLLLEGYGQERVGGGYDGLPSRAYAWLAAHSEDKGNE